MAFLRCSGLDPTEDTESHGLAGHFSWDGGVAVGSIRPRILKGEGASGGKITISCVAVGSIRPRILKEERHLLPAHGSQRCCSGLDPTEDTERRRRRWARRDIAGCSGLDPTEDTESL